jgi:hypothetical protein
LNSFGACSKACSMVLSCSTVLSPTWAVPCTQLESCELTRVVSGDIRSR